MTQAFGFSIFFFCVFFLPRVGGGGGTGDRAPPLDRPLNVCLNVTERLASPGDTEVAKPIKQISEEERNFCLI